jgi:hypothetical protein
MQNTPFMNFWNTLNQVLRSRGLPDLLYGDAKGYWNDYKGWGA